MGKKLRPEKKAIPKTTMWNRGQKDEVNYLLTSSADSNPNLVSSVFICDIVGAFLLQQ